MSLYPGSTVFYVLYGHLLVYVINYHHNTRNEKYWIFKRWDLGSIPNSDKIFYYSSTRPDNTSSPESPIQYATGYISPAINWSWRESKLSTHSTIEVRNEWSCNSFPYLSARLVQGDIIFRRYIVFILPQSFALSPCS